MAQLTWSIGTELLGRISLWKVAASTVARWWRSCCSLGSMELQHWQCAFSSDTVVSTQTAHRRPLTDSLFQPHQSHMWSHSISMCLWVLDLGAHLQLVVFWMNALCKLLLFVFLWEMIEDFFFLFCFWHWISDRGRKWLCCLWRGTWVTRHCSLYAAFTYRQDASVCLSAFLMFVSVYSLYVRYPHHFV